MFPIVVLLGPQRAGGRDPQRLRPLRDPRDRAAGLEPRDHRRAGRAASRCSRARTRSTPTRSASLRRHRRAARDVPAGAPAHRLPAARSRFNWRDPRVTRVLVLMLPVTIGLGLINFNLVINSSLGTLVTRARPRAIDRAFRIYMLPAGHVLASRSRPCCSRRSRASPPAATSTACAPERQRHAPDRAAADPARRRPPRSSPSRSPGSSTSAASSTPPRPTSSPRRCSGSPSRCPSRARTCCSRARSSASSARGSPTELAVVTLVINAVARVAALRAAGHRRHRARHRGRARAAMTVAQAYSCGGSCDGFESAARCGRRRDVRRRRGAGRRRLRGLGRARRALGRCLVAQFVVGGVVAGARQRGLRRASCSRSGIPEAEQIAAWCAAGSARRLVTRPTAHGGPGPHPQLLDHRPHRPRQVDAGRPHPRDDPHRRPAQHARPAARLDGPRARARHHDQGPGRPRLLRGAGRQDLPAAPDRHARARRLHLRGVALAGRVRGRAAGGRRVPGRRGPDGRQHLPRRRLRARADPVA